MTRRLLAVLVAGTLALTPGALHAQLKPSFSIAGGITAPLSDLRDNVDAGYNVAGALSLGAPLSPVGIRLEVGYNGFDGKSTLTSTGKASILSGTANLTAALGPSNASPYLIGGVGMYRRRLTEQGFPDDTRTVAGFNAGAGLRFPLGTMSTFVEARYHVMMGNTNDFTNLQFVPITFGISF